MAQRKLLTEVDRTLKKVSEGVELFESMYEKLQVRLYSEISSSLNSHSDVKQPNAEGEA